MSDQPLPKPFPWRTLAIVALMINFLVVGAAVGFVASGAMRRGGGDGDGPMRQGNLQALAPEQRRALMRDLADAWREGDEARQTARQTREALIEAAREEPYNEQKMRDALAAMRSGDSAVMQSYHEALLKTLGKLNAQERVAALRAAAGRPGMVGPRGRREGGPGLNGGPNGRAPGAPPQP